jgi:hypothetical protein
LKGFHRESLLSLELVKKFETFKTGSLFDIGGDFSSLSSGTYDLLEAATTPI